VAITEHLPITMRQHILEVTSTMPRQAPLLPDLIVSECPAAPTEEADLSVPSHVRSHMDSDTAVSCDAAIELVYQTICRLVPDAPRVLTSLHLHLHTPTMFEPPDSQCLCDLLWSDHDASDKVRHLDVAFNFEVDCCELNTMAHCGLLTRQGFSFYWDNRDMDEVRGFLLGKGIGFNDALEHFESYTFLGDPDSRVADFLFKDSVAHADTVSLEDVDSEIRGLLVRHPLAQGNAYRDALTEEEVFWHWLSRAGLSGADFIERCVQIAIELRRQPSNTIATPLIRGDHSDKLLERARAVLAHLDFDDRRDPVAQGSQGGPTLSDEDASGAAQPVRAAISKTFDWVANTRVSTMNRHGGSKSVKHRTARRYKPPGLERRGGKHVTK